MENTLELVASCTTLNNIYGWNKTISEMVAISIRAGNLEFDLYTLYGKVRSRESACSHNNVNA